MSMKNEMELAADILIAAMQDSAFPKTDADKTVAYFQTVYQGIHAAQDRRSQEVNRSSRPIRRLDETE